MQINAIPYPDARLPFANEDEVQRFVERHAEKMLGVSVLASSLRGGCRLCDIDILGVDGRGTPVIIECKWDRVDAAVVEFAADLVGDAETGGGVLAVDDDEIEGELSPEPRRVLGDDGAAGPADDVAAQQNPHARLGDGMAEHDLMREADGAALTVGMHNLRGPLTQVGTIYRYHGTGRDSPLGVIIGPRVFAT